MVKKVRKKPSKRPSPKKTTPKLSKLPPSLGLVTVEAVEKVSLARLVVSYGTIDLEPGHHISLDTFDSSRLPPQNEILVSAFQSLEPKLAELASLAPSGSSGSTSTDKLPLSKERELVWHMGPPEKPRVAIVGRAIHANGAVDARHKTSVLLIAERIHEKNKEHLRKALLKHVEEYQTGTISSSQAGKKLAGPFQGPFSYLVGARYAELAGPQGIYLTEHGGEIFDNWPEWSASPAPLAAPSRPPKKSPSGTASSSGPEPSS
jgi:hypothetical protein